MERTMTLIIFTGFALVGAAIIVAFLAQWRTGFEGQAFCPEQPSCNSRVNGERFCVPEGLAQCVIVDGCMELRVTACACATVDGIASCSAP